MDAAALCYDIIDEIGREKIRIGVASKKVSTSYYINFITTKAMELMNNVATCEQMAAFAETLLHFMLTISTTPSERKKIVQSFPVDIVIPSARHLLSQPSKALVIQFLRNEQSKVYLKDIEKIQPYAKNIWIVAPEKQSFRKDFRFYSLESNEEIQQYSKIIDDIQLFLMQSEDKSFRFMH